MAQGNYLGKARKNFFLSRDACEMLVELAIIKGHSEGAVLETAIRKLWRSETKKRHWKRPEKPSNKNNFR